MQIQKCNSERFISSSITLRQWTMDCPHFTSWPIRKKRRGCNSANYINTVLLWFIRVCVRSGCSVWKYKITHPTTWCSCEFDLNYFLKGHRVPLLLHLSVCGLTDCPVCLSVCDTDCRTSVRFGGGARRGFYFGLKMNNEWTELWTESELKGKNELLKKLTV